MRLRGWRQRKAWQGTRFLECADPSGRAAAQLAGVAVFREHFSTLLWLYGYIVTRTTEHSG